MLRDNLAGLIEPRLNSAGAYPLALGTDRKESSDDRPHHALKIPARQGGIYALTENVASPFHAEPRHVNAEGRPKDDCGVPPNVVVYVPIDRAQTSHALIEAETAGIVIEPGAEVAERNTRLRVQAEAFFAEVAPEKASHLARQVDEGLLTLEDLD